MTLGAIPPAALRAAPPLPTREGRPVDAAPEPDPPSRTARLVRKNAARLGGYLFGAYSAAVGIPVGIAEGVDQALHPGKPLAERKTTLSKVSVLTHSAIGAALGALVGGPVGLVAGLATGYIGSSIGNFLSNRSQVTDRLIERIGEEVEARIRKLPGGEGSRGLLKACWGAVLGVREAVKDGWRQGKIGGGGLVAGAMDGAAFVARQIREARRYDASPPSRDRRSAVSRLMETGMEALTGVSGALINLPGGLVHGALESIQGSEEERASISRPLLLFSTNLGKLILPTALGAAIGGSLGAAAGFGVGIFTGSLTSIVDGKFGINRRIAQRVERALAEVHGDGDASGYGLFYRAGKGMVAGAFAGLKEGWELGRRAGRKFVRDVALVPIEVSADDAEENQASE